MVNLKDVIALWLKTDSGLGRKWRLDKEPDDNWVMTPRNKKMYRKKTRCIIFDTYVYLHYDVDKAAADKSCRSEEIEAADPDFFKKLSAWMKMTRRKA